VNGIAPKANQLPNSKNQIPSLPKNPSILPSKPRGELTLILKVNNFKLYRASFFKTLQWMQAKAIQVQKNFKKSFQ
jgi:hypothetical protein